jgi:hypothetical protein
LRHRRPPSHRNRRYNTQNRDKKIAHPHLDRTPDGNATPAVKLVDQHS